MKKTIAFIILLFTSLVSFAQVGEEEEFEENDGLFEKREPRDDEGRFTNRTGQKERPPITEYRIIDFKNDTTVVDTSLTILKDYKFNYLRRDDFGLQPLNNVGQAHQSLIKIEERDHLLPLFGARSRHLNYIEAEDIAYYYVPTPLTELYFKTTFEQGQQLDAFFTINTSPQLNLSIAYKGIRSLGKYKHALVSTGNFRTTANFHTKNNRYRIKTHFVSQDLLNEENGGLSPRGLNQYLNNTEEFRDPEDSKDRRVIEVNFENAESTLKGKRFFMDHHYAIFKNTDSTRLGLGLDFGHIMDITDKSFRYNQAAPNELFGDSYISGNIRNTVALEDFSNELYLKFAGGGLGTLTAKAGTSNYNYGYNTVLSQVNEDGNETMITNRIKGDIVSAGGAYENSFKGFHVAANGMTIVSGDFSGNYLNASAGYDRNENYGIGTRLEANSVAPNYNFLLYQSDYIGYNWQNINRKDESLNFKNVETQTIAATLRAKNILNLEASMTDIDNYTYFTKNADSITVPRQFENTVSLLKLKLTQNIKFKWFGVDNTVVYQQVSEGDQVYRVPEIVTRNTLYYQDHWFKKALFLQTGVTFKYYSAYEADGYDPVLAEFYVQSDEEIAFYDNLDTSDPTNIIDTRQTFGGFPQVDLFFNAKIRQTRIFFKVENFTESFMQNNEFSAPGYAPRDAVLRFGIVWNFFL